MPRGHAALALCCLCGLALRTSAPDAAGALSSADLPALRPRLEAALQHYHASDEMDCTYPNRKQWWTSLSPEGIDIVGSRNPNGD